MDILKATFNSQFYYQLEKFYSVSKQTQHPFWAYCDVMEMISYNDNGSCTGVLPFPTVGLLRLEAFAPLCSGAQGILYWTMYLRPDKYKSIKNSDVSESCILKEKFVTAPFDLYGDPERVPCLVVDDVKSKIMKFSHVFLGCDVVGVQYFKRTGLPSECKSLVAGFGDINSVAVDGIGVLVSFLVTGDKFYTVILNRDFAKKQNLTVRFNNKKKNLTHYYPVSPINPVNEDTELNGAASEQGVEIPEVEGTYFNIDIKEGDMLIFEWMS